MEMQGRRRDSYLFQPGRGKYEAVLTRYRNSREEKTGRRSRWEPVVLRKEVPNPRLTLPPWESFLVGHAEGLVAGCLQDTIIFFATAPKLKAT